MREAVRVEFHQHVDARTTLLTTGDSTLVEHTKNDAYWGDGGDGSGTNMLGVFGPNSPNSERGHGTRQN